MYVLFITSHLIIHYWLHIISESNRLIKRCAASIGLQPSCNACNTPAEASPPHQCTIAQSIYI